MCRCDAVRYLVEVNLDCVHVPEQVPCSSWDCIPGKIGQRSIRSKRERSKQREQEKTLPKIGQIGKKIPDKILQSFLPFLDRLDNKVAW